MVPQAERTCLGVNVFYPPGKGKGRPGLIISPSVSTDAQLSALARRRRWGCDTVDSMCRLRDVLGRLLSDPAPVSAIAPALLYLGHPCPRPFWVEALARLDRESSHDRGSSLESSHSDIEEPVGLCLAGPQIRLCDP